MNSDFFEPATKTNAYANRAGAMALQQAFCELHELATLIGEAAIDRRMEKAHVKVNMGGASWRRWKPTAPRRHPMSSSSGIDGRPADELMHQLEALAEFCYFGTKVMVIGKLNDITLYRDLISRGVSDYLVQPFGVMDFVAALSAQYNQVTSTPLGRIIAVTGCKGGVGAVRRA